MIAIYITIVHIAITSKVTALSFESFVKSLPADVPEEIKTMMLDIHQKHPEEFTMPDLHDVTLGDFKTTSPIVTVPVETDHTTVKSTTVKIKEKLIFKPVVAERRNLGTTTEKVTEPAAKETTTAEVPPPCHQITPGVPLPVPMPMMPVPMSIYARVPIVMPMKSYFEPVIHDHPPLHKIKHMIERDEKKWQKKNKGKDCDVSVEIIYSDNYSDSDDDTESESSSESVDVGSDYYSDFIKINANRHR
ncbi:uncharacterized protein LOC124634751 [Helicoverpa zea]|uniref:uncharacterized protein LOC124634751 n=1 Tax=Helicoverpa zea TaxID=7113 RepID=UPI001F5999D4|nr:uncharacterized protein LOC124634751 [Helicoverpa zea]